MILNRSFSIFLFLALIIVPASCSKPVIDSRPEFIYTPEAVATDYYPLQTGNSWVYDVVQYSGENEGSAKSNLLVKVTSVEDWEVSLVAGGQSLKYLLTNEGIWRDEISSFLIRHPIKPYEKWPISLKGISGQSEISSVDGKVITPAGVFSNCLLVVENFPSESYRLYYWFAPNVGLVRLSEVVQVETEMITISEANLRIYSLKK